MSRRVAQYHLTTRWKLAAPVGAVWAEVSRPEGWPHWWRGILAVRLLEPGDGIGLGAYRRITWRGPLSPPVTINLRTVKVEPRVLIESVADGQVTGIGRWQLMRVGIGTDVRHDWIVNAPLPGIPLVGSITGLLFKWNHRSLMKAGYRGLERQVGVHLGEPPAL